MDSLNTEILRGAPQNSNTHPTFIAPIYLFDILGEINFDLCKHYQHTRDYSKFLIIIIVQ